MINSNVILDRYDTNCILEVAVRSDSIFYKKLTVRSEALLSSIYVKSLTPGSSLKVNYFDTTTGSFPAERYDLQSHDLITAPGTYRIIVPNIHNKPDVEFIVIGDVEFGAYGTGVNASAFEAEFANTGTLAVKKAGLCTAGRFREVVVDENWTALAATPFTRNAIAVQHRHRQGKKSDVKINWPPDALAPVGFVGMLLAYEEEREYDIQDTIVPYARVDKPSDAPVTLYVEELE